MFLTYVFQKLSKTNLRGSARPPSPLVQEGLSQFDNKKPEELESEFDEANSYLTSPLKGRNIVDYISCTNSYLMDINLATRIILDTISNRKIDRLYKHFIPKFEELQYDGQNKHLRC